MDRLGAKLNMFVRWMRPLKHQFGISALIVPTLCGMVSLLSMYFSLFLLSQLFFQRLQVVGQLEKSDNLTCHNNI